MAVSLIKNYAALVGAEAFSKIITFAAFAYLARQFGASGFGYIEWAGAVLMCASLIVDQGFNAYGMREIARNPERTSTLVTEIITARFILAALSYLLLALFAAFLVKDAALRNLLLIYGLSLLMLPLLLQWVFQGFDRMHLAAVTQVIRQTIFVAVIFLFVRSIEDLYLVGAAEVSAVAAAALFTILIYRRKFNKAIICNPRLSAALFREGMPIGLSQMFWVVKMFGATFIVGFIATSEETGYFAGAMRIYIALHTFVWLYYANLLPSLSRNWQRRNGSFWRLINKSMIVILPFSLLGGIVCFLLSPQVMRTAYGDAFGSGSGALQWMTGACVAAAVSGHFRFGLIAGGFQYKEMLVSAGGALTALAFIPIGYFRAGVSGAAAALFLAELIALFASAWIAKRKLFNYRVLSSKKNPLKNLTEAV